MADDFKPGLEGVIAFESKIAEPDKEGSALRYRGVDIDDLVGRVTFGNVWGLLVDDEFNPGLPPAEPFLIPVHTGDVRVDVQSAIAMLTPAWGLKPLLDISDDEARSNLARVSVMVLSYVAQSARGTIATAIPQNEIDKAHTVVEHPDFKCRYGGCKRGGLQGVSQWWQDAVGIGIAHLGFADVAFRALPYLTLFFEKPRVNTVGAGQVEEHAIAMKNLAHQV